MSATIALVDDDENILTTVAIALEAEGLAVRTYNDSAEALDALIEEPPNLAVLDIKMPGLDGMELLNKLRRVSQLPAIFLTSKDDEIDEMLGLRVVTGCTLATGATMHQDQRWNRIVRTGTLGFVKNRGNLKPIETLVANNGTLNQVRRINVGIQ